MAEENPTWGYTRIVGALKNVGHRVSRSTIARMLKAHGIPPVPERPTSWQTFLRAHWARSPARTSSRPKSGRGGVGDLLHGVCHRPRVTPRANSRIDTVSQQPVHGASGTHADRCGRGASHGPRALICDRDAKWSGRYGPDLDEAGIRVVQTPYQAPNANAYAERFVRSIKQECLSRMIPLGERHLRRTLTKYVEHYHRERNHQGLDNALIDDSTHPPTGKPIRRRSRLGGLLNYYERGA